MAVAAAATHLVLMRYCASATWSPVPLMVMTRSWWVESSVVSSNFEMVIMAPVICLRGGESATRGWLVKQKRRQP